METDPLTRALSRVRRRLAVSTLVERVVQLVLWAFATGCVYAILAKLVHQLPAPDRVGLTLLGGAVAGAVMWSVLRRPNLMQAAVASDRALGLKERLSSALVLHPEADRDPMVAALVRDAESRAASLDVRHAMPMRWPKRSRGAALAGTCFLALLLVPQLSWFMKPEERALITEEKRQSKKLKELAKRIERVDHRDSEGERKKLAQRLKKLAKEMKRGQLAKAEALKRYRQLTKETEEMHRKVAKANAQKPTSQALADLRNALMPNLPTASLPEGVKMALKDLIDKLKRGELSPGEQKRLAEALKRAAEALKKAGNEAAAKKLAEAAKQLQAGNCSQCAAALGEAMSDLEGALAALDAEELSAEALAELLDGRMDLALADNTCPSCGKPSALCTCENCGFG